MWTLQAPRLAGGGAPLQSNGRGKGRVPSTSGGLRISPTAPLRVTFPTTAARQLLGSSVVRAQQRGPSPARAIAEAPGQQSEAERFAQFIADKESRVTAVKETIAAKQAKVEALQGEIDEMFMATFGPIELPPSADEGEDVGGGGMARSWPDMDEAAFVRLAKEEPQVHERLVEAAQAAGAAEWLAFQSVKNTKSLVRDRLRGEISELEVECVAVQAAELEAEDQEEEEGGEDFDAVARTGRARIVLVTGFESFNVALYKEVATELQKKCPDLSIKVFSDRDITDKRAEVDAALAEADVFFGSLLFDFDQVEWLLQRVKKVPLRFVFESSLELMGATQVGSFQMAPDGKSKGPPPAVKAVLSKFSSGKEEDKMVGYLSFLKIGPKLLKFLPGKKVRDLRNWLTVYSYWNQGGAGNVAEMFRYLANEYLVEVGEGYKPAAVEETPALGLVHPERDGYFATPKEYLAWHRTPASRARLPEDAPVVAVLLYRKHVITNQAYIAQLIKAMERDGLRPLPIFINGVEAHTIVRDLLTSAHEQAERAGGVIRTDTLSQDAVVVDTVVSTVGFPLVGGPAGTMEGGRQADIARGILEAKNVPYVVAAPLLVQDIPSWERDGVAGLQSVVLYSLPELDGSVDTVPLGGLVGDDIYLVPERVRKLNQRIAKWTALRRKEAAQRKVAVLVYGFPPGVGATGTAALLNVPRSLDNLLAALRAEGYDLGGESTAKMDGEGLVELLTKLDDERTINGGPAAAEEAVSALVEGREGAEGVVGRSAGVTGRELRDRLGAELSAKMEAQWGELRSYRGIRTSGRGELVVSGVQLGNVFIGVQPLLGLEGDPMRLLFERDLTPHPQYAAFYGWLERDFGADAVVHFGMHGTVEWLPGSPLGNTGFSWSDVLMGSTPNVYVYAANNPSESIVAKRRGYGTIVSHNVPPYGRAGLYKQLAELKDLVNEFREDPEANAALRPAIADTAISAGLLDDVPFLGDPERGARGGAGGGAAEEGAGGSRTKEERDAEEAALREGAAAEEFGRWVTRLYARLAVLEGRLFSEGLHVLGAEPTGEQLAGYLGAYFGDDLAAEAVEAVASLRGGVGEVRAALERAYYHEGQGEGEGEGKLEEAVVVRDLLLQNTGEIASVLRALRGEYVAPAPGGDLLRDGPGVLPTGRNIHALDPYRMPSPAAMERGSAAARAILDQHRAANGGAYPETVAVMLWGLDAIKTRGESLAIALHLIGARPVKEGTGRVVRFELIPLEELGRPRVDVLANLSGIFRDSFANVVDLLDDLFERAAVAEGEGAEMNYIKKHAEALAGEGVDRPAARIFSNPAGDYGSMVNERVGNGQWQDGAELGDTWRTRNSYSYGRGGERGAARPEVLQALLSTTDRIVQEIDSVEYGLTDIQEYYANTGAMVSAAKTARGGSAPACSIVESFGRDVEPRDLEDTLRLEYRSKLLNPRWAKAMAAQGSGGAYEISQRMTAMVGWGGTAEFAEDWTFDQAAETYALDEEMAAKLKEANPEAFQNVVRRMLEAAGRGMWDADPKTLDKLRELYSEMDDVLEGVDIRR